MKRRTRTRTFLTAAALAASLPLAAQPAGQPGTGAEPYLSAFEGYRPFESGEVQEWRKSNDTVREIGGWRAYAREIQGGSQSPGAAAPAAAPARPAAPAHPHQGHAR